MFGADIHGHDLWWIFPVIMMALCLFMMAGRRGSMMCGPHSRGPGGHRSGDDVDPDPGNAGTEGSRRGASREPASRR